MKILGMIQTHLCHRPPPRGGEGSSPRFPAYPWTDGAFDLRIVIMVNAKTGTGQTILKTISAKPSDLYHVDYRPTGRPGSFEFAGLSPREFYVNIPIVSWNLENYGVAWKFSVSEYDLSETIKKSNTHTSEFATNFEFNVGWGEKVKKGIKFGASTRETKTDTYEIITTKGSDDLGEGILEFGSPIILKKETVNIGTPQRPRTSQHYVLNEINTGSIVLNVEPVRYRQ